MLHRYSDLLPPLLLLLLLLLHLRSSAAASNITCPYDIPLAVRMIPQECYANATTPTATSCCWFVYAAFIYAAARHAASSGAAFLPSAAADACSSAFSADLIRSGLVRPSLLLPNGSCSLTGSGDPTSSLAAGERPCQFASLSALRRAASPALANSTLLCAAPSVPDLNADQAACSSCQTAVVATTYALLNFTGTQDVVPCGMAATIGTWSQSTPSLPRFRSYALCMVQILENVNNLGSTGFVPSPPPPSSPAAAAVIPSSSGSKSRSIRIAVASAAAGLISVFGIVALAFSIGRIRRRHRLSPGGTTAGGDGEDPPPPIGGSPLPTDGLYIFTKAELKQATNDFDDRLLLGEGGAGKVYLGKLPSGQRVAIKRICREKKLAEFYREVEVLATLRHPKLTTLVGYCLRDRRHHALVYEYMPGGNLANALFHDEPLPWRRRLRIAADVAEGLAYLHELPEGAVVHRDVKPTNVLLGESGAAKLSDFGVSRILPPEGTHVSTEVRGTMGYVDPDCFAVGHVSEAADVYSFGVVLLELVTGMPAVVPTPTGGAQSIVHAARCSVEEAAAAPEELVAAVVDPRLGEAWDRPTVSAAFGAAYRCVRPYKTERPRMAEVLAVLRGALVDLEARGGPSSEGEEAALSETATMETATEESSASAPSTS